MTAMNEEEANYRFVGLAFWFWIVPHPSHRPHPLPPFCLNPNKINHLSQKNPVSTCQNKELTHQQKLKNYPKRRFS